MVRMVSPRSDLVAKKCSKARIYGRAMPPNYRNGILTPTPVSRSTKLQTRKAGRFAGIGAALVILLFESSEVHQDLFGSRLAREGGDRHDALPFFDYG